MAGFDGCFVGRIRGTVGLGGPSDRRMVCVQLCEGQPGPKLEFLRTILLYSPVLSDAGLFLIFQKRVNQVV